MKGYAWFLSVLLLTGLAACSGTESEFSDSSRLAASEKEGGLSGMLETVTAPKPLEPVEYVAWVENAENGLLQSKNLGQYRYSLLYKPKEYMIVKDLGAVRIKANEYDSLRRVYEGLDYYTFSIEDTSSGDELLKSQLGSRQEYDQRIHYYSFEMQRDIQLVSGKDTMPCSLLHFERTYSISPKANFLLGFPAGDKPGKDPETKTLIYEDRVFRTGIVKLRLEGESLKKMPGIKLVK